MPREAGHLEHRPSYGPDTELCVLASAQEFLCLSFLILKQGIITSHRRREKTPEISQPAR